MPSSLVRRAAAAARGTALVLLATCTPDLPTATTPEPTPIAPPSLSGIAKAISPTAVTLLGAGNIARCGTAGSLATAQLLDSFPNAAVFTAGDHVDGDASRQSFLDCYGPSWGRALERTRPAPGEMDYATPGAAGYFAYFGAKAADSSQGYYSYDLGAWHVMVLNDNIAITAGSPQEQWLKAELAGNTKRCTLAYWHRPRFSSSAGGTPLAAVKPLWDALYTQGVDVVVNAHEMVYERFAPQTPSGDADPARGIREFVVGTGGQSSVNAGSASPNSQIRHSGAFGALLFALDTARYSWWFLPVAGETFSDSGSASCHSRIGIATVGVTPASATIARGERLQLTATPRDSSGNPLPRAAIKWSSANPLVASVDSTGLVAANSIGGPVAITATSGGKSGTSAITVSPSRVAAIEVSPPAATVLVNGSVQLTAAVRDSNGQGLTGRVVTWSSDAPTIAATSATGLVTGLAAGTATITAASGGKTSLAAITVSASSGPPVLAGAGDIADCTRNTQEATARLLEGIAGTVITLGDNAYESGSYDQFMNCYNPSWGRLKNRTRPVPGNHDYYTPGAAGYFQYFGAAAGDPAKGYYSYDLGAWHIVAINSGIDAMAGSAQEKWLRADLAAHPTACTLAYWHHPRWSSGGNGSSLMMQDVWQALYDYGADVVLAGHDHDYERFAPQNAAGVRDDAKGIREFVVGTGGNSLYIWPGAAIANSEVRATGAWGVIKMTLWPTSYDWEFVPVGGTTFTDKGSGSCHSNAPLPNQTPVANPGGPYVSEGTLTLDGSRSRDPDNNIPLSYAWTLGDGTTATGVTVNHTYPAAGRYSVVLRVTDALGATSPPVATTVTIQNEAPTVNAGADQSVLGAFNLSARFSDPGPSDFPWTYTIAWGDGATSAGSTNTQTDPLTASHTYPAPGRYLARVTVTDKYGAAGSDDVAVTILDPSTIQIFSGAGNIATCGNDQDGATARLLDSIPGAVFALGDNANPSGTAANYTNCYEPTWGRHKARTYPIPGNIDYSVPDAAGYFGYFGAAAGDPAKGYYSFDLGNWHIIALNNASPATISDAAGSAQEQWLKADLAANTKRCTLAMFHQPRFFSSNDSSWHSAASVRPFWVDLYAAGVDVVLNGQQYFYERFAPQDADGIPDDAHGIRQFNVGTGGYAPGMPSTVAPNSEALSAAIGVLKLTLGTTSYRWEFVPVPGQSFTDSGSGDCH